MLEISRQLVQEGEELARNTTSIVRSIDALFARLTAHQTSERSIGTELVPMIERLTESVDALNDNAQTQARSAEINLRHAHSVVVAMKELLIEIQADKAGHHPARPELHEPRSTTIRDRVELSMEGQILRQRSSYRRGLVLGLTMAEIMVLLVFCLLIAMATFLKREETRRIAAEQELKEERSRKTSTFARWSTTLQKSAAVAEKGRKPLGPERSPGDRPVLARAGG